MTGLIALAVFLIWFKAVKLAQYVILFIVGIFAIIFFWESITGLLVYLASDLIELVVEYWGASILIGVIALIGLIMYWRSK